MAVGFSGNFSHTIDAKGRVTLPAVYRELLGDNFTIALNNQLRAVVLYPLKKWESMSEKFALIPETDIRGMDYMRMVQGNAFPDSQTDSQGRILLPAALRQKAHLSKNIRFVGMGQFLEIWDEDIYTALIEEQEKQIESYANYVYESYFKPKQ